MMKRILMISLKIIGVFVAAIVIFLVTVFTVNLISNKSELGKIADYGQFVAVDGKNMNVTIQGQGEETVVLLPGYGTGSPGIDFMPLVEELSPFYKVVVIEPFGYGLSDISEKERSIDNIVDETHEALQQLNIDRYILMGHSIAGIYGLEYVNRYENEVSAFVGIDSSFPSQPVEEFPAESYELLRKSGFLRLIMKLSPDETALQEVDEATKEQVRMISLKNVMNPNILSEGEQMEHNFKVAQDLTFPKKLPVFFFLAANTTDVEGWEEGHEEQIKDSMHGEVMSFEGGHYLHHTRSKEIVENFRRLYEVK
ncbi:alpha/beta fold hydrolase [Sporosarcina sp. NPDC096371]|uniref:alpha/beta hydrolase n=1 Tax=Sporosarcina sp. NPDC096371 TaxID=3364530 RepID=UPI00382917ED